MEVQYWKSSGKILSVAEVLALMPERARKTLAGDHELSKVDISEDKRSVTLTITLKDRASASYRSYKLDIVGRRGQRPGPVYEFEIARDGFLSRGHLVNDVLNKADYVARCYATSDADAIGHVSKEYAALTKEGFSVKKKGRDMFEVWNSNKLVAVYCFQAGQLTYKWE